MNMMDPLNQGGNQDVIGTRGVFVGGSSRGVDQMIFRLRGKDVSGRSAIEVVRALERYDSDYSHGGGPIRQYLIWSLNRLNGSVPPRDLDLSDRLDDEPLALGYLLLLDEYGVGKIVQPN
ncbi:MAG TPA: hypothetical protein VJU86_01665 [Pyrinomonadaceae bacterium]|nr:hypothetical protein [Pyrinomonadaceae bacterium]